MNELFSILGQIVSILDNHFEREIDAEEALKDINKIMPSLYRVAQNMDKKPEVNEEEIAALTISLAGETGFLRPKDLVNQPILYAQFETFCHWLISKGVEVKRTAHKWEEEK
jgi:hypothetical protein